MAVQREGWAVHVEQVADRQAAASVARAIDILQRAGTRVSAHSPESSPSAPVRKGG